MFVLGSHQHLVLNGAALFAELFLVAESRKVVLSLESSSAASKNFLLTENLMLVEKLLIDIIRGEKVVLGNDIRSTFLDWLS